MHWQDNNMSILNIIAPEQFKTIPWKNAKGVTIELAINDGGTLDKFDWRLSIATVSEDGAFSDFSGYSRNLVLISGNGIDLIHKLPGTQNSTDHLHELLSFASFDGSCKTFGRLHSGPITDFNLITRADKYNVSLTTYRDLQKVKLKLTVTDRCFVYSIFKPAQLATSDPLERVLKPGHLMKILPEQSEQLSITGEDFIIITLSLK